MKTNILFITSDQQHWSAMGYRNPELRTPNLDRLVASGVTFHRAYTVNPTCTPTRASWITGMYPSQHGAYSLGTKLMESVPTLGDQFRRHGYRTALVGKAHFQPLLGTEDYPTIEGYPALHDLGFWRTFHGPFYGFDHVELARNHTDESHVGQHYAIWMEEKGYPQWREYFVPNLPRQTVAGDPLTSSTHRSPEPGRAWEIPEEIHYDTWIAERTSALLREFAAKGESFFLWASFFDPHPRYMVPQPYASMYDPARVTVPEMTPGELDDKPPYFALSQEEQPDFSVFEEPGGHGIHGSGSHLASRELKATRIATMYGMMTMLDVYVGKIMDELTRLGLAESTLICYTTDHGDFLGQHGLTMKAIHHYEDLLKVPLVVSLPGTVPGGRVSDSLQSTVDLPQTFLSVAGLPVPRSMTGVDEKPVWFGQRETIRNHVLVENQHQPTTMNMRTYIEARHKITVHFNRDYGELYDLQEDPGEIKNLWDRPEHRKLKSRLLLRFLHAEMARAPLPMPRISGA